MFFSHEILSSRQYGVATIWVVATVGDKSTHRRLTRKAIQEVDVPKACGTISDPPGAPIALRLQGSLLYGVSRVYSQQCQYVLTDVEKVFTNVRRMLRLGDDTTLDPNAGKTKRTRWMIPDDPNFNIISDWDLPSFHLDASAGYSRLTLNQHLQLSPMGQSQSSCGGSSLLGGINFSQQSVLGDLHLTSPFGGSTSAQKPGIGDDPFGEEEPFELQDVGLIIDAEGNITESPELPALPDAVPDAETAVVGPPAHPGAGSAIHDQQEQQPDEGVQQPIVVDKPLLDPYDLPAHEYVQEQLEPTVVSRDQTTSAPVRARKKRLLEADNETKISRTEYIGLSYNYLVRMNRGRAVRERRRRPRVTEEQARRNAYDALFGHGIGGVGANFGRPGFAHPLADHFAGQGLERTLFGRAFSGQQQSDAPRGRRRGASEALGDEAEHGEERRVRPRGDSRSEREEQPHSGLNRPDDVPMVLGDVEVQPEVGREQGHELSDHPSLPWHRQSSVVPGSSVKGSSTKRQGQSGAHQVQDSPLTHYRRSAIQYIQRSSDDPLASGGMRIGQDLGFGGSSSQEQSGQGNDGGSGTTLSSDARDFLAFLQGEAVKKGSLRDDRDETMWIRFEDIIEPGSQKQTVAALAFYKVLSLVTSHTIRVRQEGTDKAVPYGTIHIGVPVGDGVDVMER